MCTKSASLSNPDTDLGKERRVRSSVTVRMADNKVGNHSGLLLRKPLSQDGLSCTVGTHRIWRLAAPAGWLSLAAVTYNGHNSCVLEQCHGVSNSQKNIKEHRVMYYVHSKAGLNLCPQPFPTSYLPLPQSCHTRLFPPLPSPLPSHLGCATPTFCPWGRWFSLRSGYLLPDTPTLLSLDLSALPYLCLVNNKWWRTFKIWSNRDTILVIGVGNFKGWWSIVRKRKAENPDELIPVGLQPPTHKAQSATSCMRYPGQSKTQKVS